MLHILYFAGLSQSSSHSQSLDHTKICVKFIDELEVKLVDGQIHLKEIDIPRELQELLHVGTYTEMIMGLSSQKLDSLRKVAQLFWDLEVQRNKILAKRKIAKMQNYFFVELADEPNVDSLLQRFKQSPYFDYAAITDTPMPLPNAPPNNFVSFQTYLNATDGINATGVHSSFNNRGNGVRVVDIEYNFNNSHQDLPNISIVSNTKESNPFNSDDHGTAVLGELVSRNNGTGTAGIASSAQALFAGATDLNNNYNIANAVLQAANAISPGDFILIEQQIAGPYHDPSAQGQFGLVAVEYRKPNYDAILIAVGNNRIVVEAAGNGSQNLDDPLNIRGDFNHYPFNNANDSGAIIVGAGAAAPNGSTTARSRLGFSNYGSRLNLQGFGERVWTTGYGDSYSAEGRNYEYTAVFGGTSSASPIVTGAGILLQSVYQSSTGNRLTPLAIRSALISTGKSQRSGAFPSSQKIGPLPNVLAAINAVIEQSCAAPTSSQITASNITSTSARLNCSVSNVVSYDWAYRIAGGEWQELNHGPNNFIDISGLSPNTTYEFASVVNCDGTAWSEWSPIKSFSTSGGGSGGGSLELANDIVLDPNPLVRATPGTLAFNLTNTANTSFTGIVLASLYKVEEDELPFIENVGVTQEFSLCAACSFSSNLVFNINVDQAPGEYVIVIWYRPDGGDWVQVGSTDHNNYIYFTITEENSNCTAPTSSQVTASNINATSARLNCAITNAQAYDWVYREQGTSTWTEPSGTTQNFINITGLTPNTTYEFASVVRCGASTWSDWSPIKTFTTSGGGGTSGLQMATQLSLNPAPVVQGGSSTISFKVKNNGNSTFNGIVAIDLYRQAGDDLDAIAEIGSLEGYSLCGGCTSSSNISFTVTITEDVGAYAIIAWYKPDNGDWMPIGDNDHDNIVLFDIIESTVSCDAPTSSQVFATQITSSSARLNCAVNNVDVYDWAYREQGSSTWTEPNGTTQNFLDIDDLNSNTTYEFTTVVRCGPSTWSDWSPIQTFTTSSDTNNPWLEMASTIDLSVNPVPRNSVLEVSFDLKNVGSNSYSGEVAIDLYKDTGESFEAIAEIGSVASFGLCGGCSTSDPVTFEVTLDQEPGNYAIIVWNKPAGEDWIQVGTSNFDNLITFEVIEPSFLSLTPSTLNLSNGSSTRSITVNSNVSWAASESTSWLLLSGGINGNGNGSFSISATSNNSTNPRTATVSVSGGGLTRTISITQAGNTAELSISPEETEVGASAGCKEFQVSADVSWTISNSDNWITSISPTSGNGNQLVTACYTENNSSNPRSAQISLQGGSISTSSILKQAGQTIVNTLSFDPGSILLGWEGNGITGTLTTQATNGWTAVSSESWLNVSPNSGTGSASIQISAISPNTQNSSRIGTITFQSNNQSLIVDVEQLGQSILNGSPWGEPTPTISSGTLIGQAQIEGMPAAAGDWIAAFDEQGNLAGAKEIIINSGLAYINLVIYGDDPNTSMDEGINAGEGFSLQLYDASRNEFLAYPDANSPQIFTEWVNTNGAPMPAYKNPNDIYNFGMQAYVDVIPLRAGWNLVSTDVVPQDSSILEITANLASNNLEYVTGFDQEANFYDPNLPPLFSTLTHVKRGFGYWIRVKEVDTLRIPGQLLTPTYFKTMDAGWNLISYLPQGAQTPEDYLESYLATGQLQYVTGFDGAFTFYDPEGLPFLNDLQFMENGFGYWVNLELPTPPSFDEDMTAENSQPNPIYEFLWGATNLQPGEEIEILDEDGKVWETIRTGPKGLFTPNTLYGDNPNTSAVEGPRLGSLLQFRWRNKMAKMNPLTFNGSLRALKLDLYFPATKTNSLEAYPSPFTDELKIRFGEIGVSGTEIVIRDSRGIEVWRGGRSCSDCQNQEWTWRPNKESGGLYWITLYQGKEPIAQTKALLIR